MGKILSIGIPIACQDGLIQVAFIVITIIANRRGLNDAAAVGIVEKIISFLFLVPSSMLSAVSALGAQNIGAKKPERAIQTLRYAILIAVSFGLVVSVLIQFQAEEYCGIVYRPQCQRVERRSCGWAVSISKAIFGTACLWGFIFASVVISVPAESRDYRFYITFLQLC